MARMVEASSRMYRPENLRLSDTIATLGVWDPNLGNHWL